MNLTNLKPAATESLKQAWLRVSELLPTGADLSAVRRNPRQDLIAGLTVAIVALPSAHTFGVASGPGRGER